MSNKNIFLSGVRGLELRPSILVTKFLFFLYSILLLLLSVYIGDVLFSITLYFIFTLSVIVIFNNGTLSDPRMLFVGFLFLYSSFFPLRVYLTEFSLLEINHELLKQTLNYSFLGAVVFVNIANAIIRENNVATSLYRFKKKSVLYLSEKLLLVSFFFVVLFMLFYVMMSGAETKADVSGPIVTIGHFSFLLLTTIIALLIGRSQDDFFKNYFGMGFILLSIIYVLITGERDAIFRVILIFLIVYFDHKNNAKPLVIIALLSIAVIVIPFSQAFKSVLLSGQLNIPSLGMGLILSNEFISASRNLYALALFEAEQSIEFFFTDIGRAFVPNILLPNFDLISSNNWFHNTFRVEHGFEGSSGWGFGIIAFGYLIGGGYGIVFTMSLYAAIICFFFNKRMKSIYWYVFYLLMLATAIYCIRADLANFLSQSFKISGVYLMLIIATHLVMKKEVHKEVLEKYTIS